MTFSVDMSIQK